MKWTRINWCTKCDEPMEENKEGVFYCEHCDIIHTGRDEEPKPTDSAGFNLKSLYK